MTHNIKLRRHTNESWVLTGRPRHEPALECKKLTNAMYKYAVCYVSKMKKLRQWTVAEKLICNNVNDLWKEVRAPSKSSGLPWSIEEVSG